VYNLVCIPLAFTGVLSAWLAGLGMALSSLLVIGNALRLSRPQSAQPFELAQEVM
jgi:Cu2+-exporting ATPase